MRLVIFKATMLSHVWEDIALIPSQEWPFISSYIREWNPDIKGGLTININTFSASNRDFFAFFLFPVFITPTETKCEFWYCKRKVGIPNPQTHNLT